jgi:hypothetical protein
VATMATATVETETETETAMADGRKTSTIGLREVLGLFAFAALLGGCENFRSSSEADDGDDEGAGDEAPSDSANACLGEGGPIPVGSLCTRNEDCESGVCAIFRDAPRNEGATCLETPPECATHVMGTVLDFETGAGVPNVPVVLASAVDALDDPLEAEPILVLHTDGVGRIDGVTDGPMHAPLAVLALSASEDHALTATGVAQPPLQGGTRYEVGTGIHDIWLVPHSLSEQWSQALAADEDVPSDALPLSRGCVVGLVRDPSGRPIAGADVYSEDPESRAIIRTVGDDGTLRSGPTGSSGMFVVLHSETPEDFGAVRDGEVVGRASSGRLPGAFFVMILQDLSGG